MTSTEKLVAALAKSDNREATRHFVSAMREKVGQAIAVRKVALSAQVFGSSSTTPAAAK